MPPAVPGIVWRCAKFDDLDARQLHAIFVARQVVFVVEQECAYLDADGLDLASWHVLGETAGDGLVAYARLLPPGAYFEEPSIGRVLTAPAVRGQGTGHELMRRALGYCREVYPEFREIRIAAQQHLQGFYAQHGFQRASDPYVEDGIPHIQMLRGVQEG